MESVMNFLANNYIYFLIGALVLGAALVGLIVSIKKKGNVEKSDIIQNSDDNVNVDEINASMPEVPVGTGEMNTEVVDAGTQIEAAPSLDGFEGNTNGANVEAAVPGGDIVSDTPTLIIEDNTGTAVQENGVDAMFNTPTAEPVVSDEPTLIIEDPSAKAVETPAAETPVVDAPVAEMLVVDAPVEAAPVVETPVAEAPVAEMPVAEVTPVVETPTVEASPVVEAPVEAAPVVETPAVEAPVAETPVVEQNIQ